jgi:thiamine phosphate synthase YjbQ (UPF0047 family)
VVTTVLDVDTSDRLLVDLTDEVSAFCSGRGDGLLNVFVPHATAGLAVGRDRRRVRAGPARAARAACCRGTTATPTATARPAHGADHVLPALLSPSLVVPVAGGRPLLGTWQRIVLVDLNTDNPGARCAAASPG